MAQIGSLAAVVHQYSTYIQNSNSYQIIITIINNYLMLEQNKSVVLIVTYVAHAIQYPCTIVCFVAWVSAVRFVCSVIFSFAFLLNKTKHQKIDFFSFIIISKYTH